jgi:hypothetical protein
MHTLKENTKAILLPRLRWDIKPDKRDGTLKAKQEVKKR